MIVSQAEIEFVTKGRCHRLLLPVERGEQGELLPCPVEEGELICLQPRLFAKSVKLTATRISPTFASEAPAAAINPRGATGPVWCVEFVLGNHTAFFARHRERYLKAKGVGLTVDPARAVHGEPAVTSAEQLVISSRARERRELEQEQRWQATKRMLEAALREMRAEGGHDEGDVRFLERRLAAMDRKLRERQAA